MPAIADNLAVWNRSYHWSDAGDEWSHAWGSPDAQWWGAIYPRIYPFAPTGTILEIAPGFGRWTGYLAAICRRLIAVDLSPNCVARCRERFRSLTHAEFHTNDGCTLPMVEDREVDFAFSFDSLVHCDLDVLTGYLREFSRTLAPEGVAFIHHSNVGAYWRWEWLPRVRPRKLTGRAYAWLQSRYNPHWRAANVSAELVRDACAAAGLVWVTQEIVNWGGHQLSDCFSTIVRAGSKWARAPQIIVNPQFMDEAERLRRRVIAAGGEPLGEPSRSDAVAS
jgi:SAM-dependent methyltransferase